MNSNGSLEAFPSEIIIKISEDLSIKKKLRLAKTCRRFMDALAPSLSQRHTFSLRRRINMFQLRALTHLVIEHRHCSPVLVKHIFTYAIHLNQLTFEPRATFTEIFVALFFQPYVTRPVTYILPRNETAITLFNIARTAEYSHVTIEYPRVIPLFI